MDNFGYTHYYGRHKKGVGQKNVVQSEKKQFRLSGDLLKEFNRHKDYYKNESEFIRVLISKGIAELNREEISDL